MIKWNKVTWYSWYGALFLFIVILPVLSFYIGTKYEATREALASTSVVSVPFSVKTKQSPLVVSSSTPITYNSKKDLWAVNAGAQGIEFMFKDVPDNTVSLRLSHGVSISGPWIVDATTSYSATSKQIVNKSFGTKQTLYYTLDALSDTDVLLKSWNPVLVKKVSAQ